MDEKYKNILKITLQEEIARIESAVSALGAPTTTEDRSLIARYGKLLLVSQSLVEALSRVAVPLGREDASSVAALLPIRNDLVPDKYVAAAHGVFSEPPPEHI